MKRKARIQTGIDDRLVAIYARKSRITNKGDSIGVQFKQSADYAINQLSLPEDYEFARYEDKGLSGYYSDRPDFQRLLRDIEMGKIKAVACYKLDRISRKTSDLMRLLEYFERHDVTLLVCSNNINTRISTSKIIIQVLAIIAEFERDILTERIQDNLMELAKDGRWLGGKTPTGFSSQRVTTGSGKNKSAISFLVPVQEEEDGEEHAPVADGGGDTTAYASHFRHAHMSVDKDIVAGNIDQKADNANDHGRSCPAKALEKGTHCNEEQKARQSEKHCLEIP